MKVEEAIERLEKLKKESGKYEILMLIFLYATIASSFFLAPSAKNCLIAYGVGITAAIIMGARASKYHKQYRKVYKEVFVTEILKEKLEDVHYDWQRGFTGVDMYDSQLLNDDRNISDDYLKASYNGIRFEQADLKHFEGGKNSRISFRGKIMKFTGLPVNVSNVWIYSKSFKLSARYYSKSIKMISILDNEFAKVFDVYAFNESDVKRILTPQFREKLLILAKKNEALGMSFKGNKLYMGIHTSRDTFDVDVSNKKIDYDNEVEKVKKDVDDIIEVVEMMI